MEALGNNEDPARLAHHAREADDAEAIVMFAPRAARAALAIESHREAVAHFRNLEPYLELIGTAEQATSLDDWAQVEFYLDNVSSLDLLDRAIELDRSLGEVGALARALTLAARVNRAYLRMDEAMAHVREAVSLLEVTAPTVELAIALSTQAFLEWVQKEDVRAGIESVDHAMSIAEQTGGELAMIRALNVKGNIIASDGDRSGMALVEDSGRRAEQAGYRFEEIQALSTMTGMAADVRDVERASDFAQRARDTAARYEMRMGEVGAQANYAEILMWKGEWAAAQDTATEVLGSNPMIESLGWRVLATLQARQGRSQARSALERRWALAEASGQHWILDPAAAVLAEYMWLSGKHDPVWLSRLQEILDTGMGLGKPWPSGALAFWTWKLGLLEKVPDGTADFYGWIIKGEHDTAAEFWETRGIPYEHGLALMHGDDAQQIEAIRIFEELGAAATANRVRRALLDKGVQAPRGRSRSTRDHAAGLTARQAEVLELLAKRLTNAEIADRLFVSYRTVENHVAAILMKLDVPTREAAVQAALDRGHLPIG